MKRIQQLAFSFVFSGSLISFYSHGQQGEKTDQGHSLNRFESNLLNKASSLIERNDFDAALVMMQPLLEQNAPHPTVFQYACKTIADTGDEIKALSCWQRGYKLYPQKANIAINLAHAQLQFEHYKAALASLSGLDFSTLDEPISAQVRYMRGYAHYQQGQYQAVLTELLSHDVKLHWWPLISYSQLALEQWQAAKDSAESWLALEPINRSAWQVLTRSELGLDHPVEAAVASDIAANLHTDRNKGVARDSIGLFGQIKAYNLAASCTQFINSKTDSAAFASADFSCAQYAWISGRYQTALNILMQFDMSKQNQLHDDFYVLQGQLFAALKQGDKARNAWIKVGLQSLPTGSASEIKHARQRRNELQGQALLLIGQSYWLEGLWPEAEASYRKLAQTPGFETIAAAFSQRLTALVLFE
ncbi:tetratricopeptide repeat protein [Shewanella algidipiscicola]|nr:tetratricopeptide repeat protein [Shewanella algidipiscicola]